MEAHQVTGADSLIKTAIRSSPAAWFETYGKIWPKDRGGGLIAPKCNYLQKKIEAVVAMFSDLGLPCRIVALKPRQRGSTTFFAACCYTAMRRKPTVACVIGGQYSQTDELFKMIQTYCSQDKFDWGNSGEINAKAGAFSNGSRLKPETAGDQLAGIASTIQFLECTEVARWSKYGVANAGDVLSNVLKCVPMVADTTVIMESTAEGNSGEFYERFITAVDMEEFLSGKTVPKPGEYVRVFAPWFEFEDSAIRLTDDEKDAIKTSLDSEEEFQGEQDMIERYSCEHEDGVTRLGATVVGFDVWEQLAFRRMAIRQECKRDRLIFSRDYPHSWQDAFLKSGNLRFSQTGVSMLRRKVDTVVPKYGVLEEVKGGRRPSFRITGPGEATVMIFEMPEPGRRYIEGIDPMTGITQTGSVDPDFHGVFILRQGYYDARGKWVKPATAARIVPCRWEIDVVEEHAFRLARFYGPQSGCKIVIEMNQDRGITELLKLRGADLYQREIFNRRDHVMSKALGYQTNEKTREVLVECMATAIRDHDVPGSGIDILCAHAVTQAENFIRKANGRSEAAEGHKDDDIFSIGLALTCIDHATTYVPERGATGWWGPPEDRPETRRPSQYS